MTTSRTNGLLLVLLVLVAMATSGCELVEGIFKAGFWVGIFMVAIVVAIIMWVMAKVRH